MIGIGGSAPGLQFVSNALGEVRQDKREIYFFDSSDSDGFDNVLSHVKLELRQTRRIDICKSGGMHESTGACEKVAWTSDGHAVPVASQGGVNDNVTIMCVILPYKDQLESVFQVSSAASRVTSSLNA